MGNRGEGGERRDGEQEEREDSIEKRAGGKMQEGGKCGEWRSERSLASLSSDNNKFN